MVTSNHSRSRRRSKQPSVKSIKLEFADDPVTAFGGLALTERLATRLGLWSALDGALPRRSGRYSWLDVIKSSVAGLLTGSRGTVSCEEVRADSALRALLGVSGAPEEATFWRDLARLGSPDYVSRLERVQRWWARRTLAAAPRGALLRSGFFQLFGDGSLLEGSRRREGTKTLRDKGSGLMWSAWFAGPALAAQRLAGPGQGEQSCLRAMLPEVLREVVDPLNLRAKTLLLQDSLHGDGPTLDLAEAEGVKYLIGANKLAETQRVLRERVEMEWSERGAVKAWGWSESAVCLCWIQCAGWTRKRLLVGRRWRREDELPGMPYHFSGIVTNLCEADVAHLRKGGGSLVDVLWRLYDGKGACEDLFKDILEDLSGHHPPCEELVRNRGYYALVSLAHTLACGVDVIAGAAETGRGDTRRQDGGRRKRSKPRRMRLWRLRRRLLAIPARIGVRGRQATVTALGVAAEIAAQLRAWFLRLSRC